ncbi:MAG: hypothetical protein J6K75_00795 [Erysipelotrichaceae bacterium]|nr:hypothetical protein [Erysipelotrichaceae bacterium]
MANGLKPFPLESSNEEAVELIKALLGFETKISNVNLPNQGQMPQLPIGSIVETNCIISSNQLKPVVSKPLPLGALGLVQQNCTNIDLTYAGIKKRNLEKIFAAFVNQPLCAHLSLDECKALFKKMCMNTRTYLDPWFDLDSYFNKS